MFLVIIILFFVMDFIFDFNIESESPTIKVIFGVSFLIISVSSIIFLTIAKFRDFNLPISIEINQFEILELSLVLFLLALVLLFKR